MMKDSILHKIRKNNFRVSRNLMEILDVLSNAEGPLTVQEIGQVLAIRNIEPNKTTLYRQVEKLTGLGLIQETVFTDSIKRYCLVDENHHHHHFYCRECGYAEELPELSCQVIPDLEKLYIRKGFNVTGHTLEIEGVCDKCNI